MRQLGKGGQGTVFLAKDNSNWIKKELIEKALSENLFKFSKAYNEADRMAFFQSVLEDLRAWGTENEAPVGALKVIHKSEDDTLNEQASARLGQEITVLSKVQHPSLIRILDSNLPEKWFVTDYFQRRSLDTHLTETKGDVLGALMRVRPLIEAVAALHREGFVHRDIKPQNIFVADDGRLVLGDCGLVFDTNSSGTRLTLLSEKVGTTDFMPAWVMGSMRIEDIRPSFDVFSLGKLIWCMISGKAVLRLHYHRDTEHPEFDVEKLFPNAPEMAWARRLFEKCIVERKESVFRMQISCLLKLIRR